MTGSESNGARKSVERRIVLDAEGRLERVVGRIGFAEVVLATRGRGRKQILMPSPSLVDDRLAELAGTHGGPIKMSYDQTERDMLDQGFRVSFLEAHDFLRCTERGRPDSPVCRSPECPWEVEGEEYAPDECPMDHWKTVRR